MKTISLIKGRSRSNAVPSLDQTRVLRFAGFDILNSSVSLLLTQRGEDDPTSMESTRHVGHLQLHWQQIESHGDFTMSCLDDSSIAVLRLARLLVRFSSVDCSSLLRGITSVSVLFTNVGLPSNVSGLLVTKVSKAHFGTQDYQCSVVGMVGKGSKECYPPGASCGLILAHRG